MRAFTEAFKSLLHKYTQQALLLQHGSSVLNFAQSGGTVRMSYADFGDSIDGKATVFIGLHSCLSIKAKRIPIPTPPQMEIVSISHFLLEEYNKVNYALSYAKSSREFIYQGRQMVAKDTVQEESQRS